MNANEAVALTYFKAELNEALEAIKRVRELHKLEEYDGESFCSECITGWNFEYESASYPCDTIKALDGEK